MTTCDICGVSRTSKDPAYTPMSIIITGRPVGWYSGDDGEMCESCLTFNFENQ